MWVCVCFLYTNTNTGVPWNSCGGHRTNFKNLSFLSIAWVLKANMRFSSLVTSVFTHGVTLLSPDVFILISLAHAAASLVPPLNIWNTNFRWSCNYFILLWELATYTLIISYMQPSWQGPIDSIWWPVNGHLYCLESYKYLHKILLFCC